MIDVLLVEDHELFRMGLSMLLSKEESINLVAEASDGLDGVKKARDFEPNVILMISDSLIWMGLKQPKELKIFYRILKF